MSKLTTLKDALLDELKDLYSAENQLLKALPKMAKKAANEQLKEAFEDHLAETEGHVERLLKIATLLEEKVTGKTCKAMQGLVEEGKEVIEEESENEALIDALLIGAAQRVEHYEVAAYGTAIAMAQELGENEVAKLLMQTLDEEKAADEKLSAISTGEVLVDANTFPNIDEEDDDKSAGKLKPQSGKKPGHLSRSLAIVGLALLSTAYIRTSNADPVSSDKQHENKAAQYEADNTGRNARDLSSQRTVADDQKVSGKDLEVLARVRRELVANSNLSTNGQNVKILVENRTVILRGPVKSIQEKTWIEGAAAKAAMGYTVSNQLEVSPS